MLVVFHVCHAVLPVPCTRLVIFWERADLLAILCVIMSCVFVTCPYGVLGQVWYLIVPNPDRCLLLYFVYNHENVDYIKYGYFTLLLAQID